VKKRNASKWLHRNGPATSASTTVSVPQRQGAADAVVAHLAAAVDHRPLVQSKAVELGGRRAVARSRSATNEMVSTGCAGMCRSL